MNRGIKSTFRGIEYVCTSHFKETSELASVERNDCVVRAMAEFLEVDYDTSHSFIGRKFGRVARKGTFGVVGGLARLINDSYFEKTFGKKVVEVTELIGRTVYGTKVRKKTIGTFLKEERKGSYFIIVSGHALCIKDGVVYGNVDDVYHLRSRIVNIYTLESC